MPTVKTAKMPILQKYQQKITFLKNLQMNGDNQIITAKKKKLKKEKVKQKIAQHYIQSKDKSIKIKPASKENLMIIRTIAEAKMHIPPMLENNSKDKLNKLTLSRL